MRYNCNPPRTSPGVPQNLLRPTSKGCGASAQYVTGDCTRSFGCKEGTLAPGPAGLGKLGALDSDQMNGVGTLIATAGLVGGLVHGFKRNRGSVGWAVWWGLMGGLFPIITIPVALLQGYGKPASR